MTDRLHPDDLRDLAELVVQRLAARLDGHEVVPHHARAVDVKTLARELGMSPAWVYRNADALHAERRGAGPRARLRFDLEKARQAFGAATAPERVPCGTHSPTLDAGVGGQRTEVSTAPLLPVKGDT